MWVIDRCEGDKAVIEYKNKIFDVPKAALPAGAKEGDVLKVIIDEKGTAKKQKEIDQLKNNLFK